MSGTVLISHDPEETQRLGVALGQVLQPGDIVGLVGELGAGKTHFVRGVAQGAEVPEGEVASPTFAIVYTYEGRLKIHHADLYRVETEDELYATGFGDLPEPGAALLVEWLNKIPAAVRGDFLRLTLQTHGETVRHVRVDASGDRSKQLLIAWKHALGL